MEITWYGLSCFRLTERGKASVVTDPYDDKRVGLSPLKVRSDIVSVSHEAPGHSCVDAIKGVKHTLNGPGEFEIGEVFITAVRTKSKKRSKEETALNTVYVFDYDGVTVAHLGDLQRSLTQSEVDALGMVNIALVPVGGGNSLTASQASEVVSMLDPGYVIPMHYKTKETKVLLSPLSKFINEMGLSEVKPIPSLKVTASSIPTETQIVVLELSS
jgi:L-ascorbate metabolism protein UlaG (beta-lactamase superfamily)